MAEIRIRKRKRMRAKDIKSLSDGLTSILQVPVFTENDPVDLAEGPDFNLIYVGNDILGQVCVS